jgi:hypothetical protein
VLALRREGASTKRAFRHADPVGQDFDEEDPSGLAPSKHGLNYIKLDGGVSAAW